MPSPSPPQDERLQALEKEFEDDVRTLEAEFAAEKGEIRERFATDSTELHAVTDTIAAEVKERMSESKSVRSPPVLLCPY